MSNAATHGVIAVAASLSVLQKGSVLQHIQQRDSYLGSLHLPLGQDLLENLVLILRAEFVLESGLRCTV
jgi:hypothetical protein